MRTADTYRGARRNQWRADNKGSGKTPIAWRGYTVSNRSNENAKRKK